MARRRHTEGMKNAFREWAREFSHSFSKEAIMNVSRSLINALLLSLILNAPLGVLAQEKAPKQTEPDAPEISEPSEEDQTAQRELALQTLNAIIPEIDKIKDFRERVRLKARAAGLLWNEREAQARLQFQQLLRSIAQYQLEGEESNVVKWRRNQLRQEVIQEAMRYDREFAEELAKWRAEKDEETDREEAETPPADPKADLKERAARADRLVALALQTFSENPERALKLADESLAEGVVSPQLLNLLIPLKMSLGANRTNPLFERVLTLLLQNPYLTTFQLQILAVYIFPDLQLGNLPSEKLAVPVVAASQIHQFFDLMLRILKRTARWLEQMSSSMPAETREQLSQHAYFLARQVQPKLERYGTPDAVVALNALIDQLGRPLTQEQRQMIEANANPRANIAKILDLAKQETEPSRRDAYYAQAAMSAYGSGDYHNALKIAERIEDREQRQHLVQQIKQLLVQVFTERGEFNAAARYARELEPLSQRAWGLNWVARALAKKEDRLRAVPLLVEAEHTARKLGDSVEKAQVMLWITETHVQLESLRAFELLSHAVKSINRAFDEKGRPRFSLASPVGSVRPSARRKIQATNLFRFEPLFPKLAREDFTRVIGIAQELDRPELRLTAQLIACRAILADH